MPGSVQNAAPLTVLPASLCRAFVREQQVPVLECEYPDGSSQWKALAASIRKRWRLSKRLRPAQLATLRDFYEARRGAHEPFYFHDPYERNSKFSSDPSAASLDGRYVVRFDGALSQEIGMLNQTATTLPTKAGVGCPPEVLLDRIDSVWVPCSGNFHPRNDHG